MDLQNTIFTYCMGIFLVPAISGLIIFAIGRYGFVFREFLALVSSIFMLYLSYSAFKIKHLSAWNNEFRMDQLSGFVSLLISCISVLVVLYSIKYMKNEAEHGLFEEKKLTSYYGWIMLFISTMQWVTSTNNIMMLWVIIEGTTIASAMLVAFYWNKNALEAGYKYLMLLTVGITFALFGCVLLYAGASPHVKEGLDPLQITNIASVAHLIPKSIAILAIAFLLVGFGTKAGIVPFHAWLPDAHAEAPTPVSVLLSGIMIKVGAYALARVVCMFYPMYPMISVFVVILGLITMVVGVIMMFTQEDIKRFLAYSSVSQIGYIIMGLGFGGVGISSLEKIARTNPEEIVTSGAYLGIYGSLFHLLNHGIIKSLLFMCAGAAIYATGLRRVNEVSGIGKKMPLTGFCFFVGAMAISGVPLLNGFMSKFTLFLAGAKVGMLWATIIAIICSIFTLATFLHVAYSMFMGKESEAIAESSNEIKLQEVPSSMWIGFLMLTVLCFLFGIYPQVLHPVLDGATKNIMVLLIR